LYSNKNRKKVGAIIRGVMEEIKSITKDKIKFEFGNIKEISNFFRIETKVIFNNKLFNTIMVQAPQGDNKHFLMNGQIKFNIESVQNLENKFYAIFSQFPEVRPKRELLREIDLSYRYLITDSVSELAVENFKLSKQYKMRSLYDEEFKKLF
jgi:hypothetical protein